MLARQRWCQQQLGSGGSSCSSAVAAAQRRRRQQRGNGGGGNSAAVVAAVAAWRQRWQGQGGLIMVGLSMDASIHTQVDLLLGGHISGQIPTHVGDVNSQNQNKSW